MYITKAFIVEKDNRGEESEQIVLYTKEYGLIYTHSQASKKTTSKLRPQLNTYALLYVNLVHGKTGWKITGVEEIESPFQFSRDVRFRLLHTFSKLIKRFEGNEKNKKLWAELEYLFSFLKNEESIQFTEQYNEEINLIITIRTLSALGYWNRPGKRLPRYTREDCEFIRKGRLLIKHKITEAIEETQL